MNPILLALSPHENRHLPICTEVLAEAKKHDTEIRPLHDRAFLISGPMKFELAMSLVGIAQKGSVPLVVCEVEDVLMPSVQLDQTRIPS